YYHRDHLGGPAHVTDTQGNLVAYTVWHPYGLEYVKRGLQPNHTFTGAEREPESEVGLIQMGARWYAPKIGRWVSADPLFLSDPSVSLKRPMEANLYGYVAGNPLNATDPSGLGPEMLTELDEQVLGTGPVTLDTYKTLGVGLRDWEYASRLQFRQGLGNFGGSLQSSYSSLGQGELGQAAFFAGQALGGLADAVAGALSHPAVAIPSAVGAARMLLRLPALGESLVADAGTVRVGRWMSQAEADAMAATGRVQAPMNGAGAAHVTVPPNPAAFDPPLKSSTFVEFDVPASQLRLHDPTQGWGRVFGPGSLEARLAARKGLPVPSEMPPATNQLPTASAWPRRQ
ncbi:MAG: RHS repeat-associated core domain-containing protein, partial [Myxococcota bacterium]